MTDPQRPEQSRPDPESAKTNAVESHGAATAAKPPPGPDRKDSPAGQPAAPKPPTEEEQMALYENDLKENDWGHRPC